MERLLAQDICEEKRFEFLKDSSDAVEVVSYTRRFTPDELAQKKESLAEISIRINDIEVEKKEAMDEFKERLKVLNVEKKELLSMIKAGAEQVEEECAKILYHDERMGGFYNKLGELVYSRPIMTHEMQRTMFSINSKTGTNN